MHPHLRTLLALAPLITEIEQNYTDWGFRDDVLVNDRYPRGFATVVLRGEFALRFTVSHSGEFIMVYVCTIDHPPDKTPIDEGVMQSQFVGVLSRDAGRTWEGVGRPFYGDISKRHTLGHIAGEAYVNQQTGKLDDRFTRRSTVQPAITGLIKTFAHLTSPEVD